jgi:tripartite ATP-independent transporter DctM subunit
MLAAGIWAKRRGYGKERRSSLSEILRAFLQALPSLLLLVIVIGGIVAGVFTATEASAVAVLYCLVLAFYYREVSVKDLKPLFLRAVGTTAIVMLLIGTSMSMSWVMAFEHLPERIANGLLAYTESKFAILLVINLVLLFVGIFMDMTPAVLIFTPIFLPVVTTLGMDPVHFGIVMILNLCIGLCTPPVGSVLFVGVGVAGTTISRIIRPLLPLFAVMLLVLLLITYVPGLSTWLPKMFGY